MGGAFVFAHDVMTCHNKEPCSHSQDTTRCLSTHIPQSFPVSMYFIYLLFYIINLNCTASNWLIFRWWTSCGGSFANEWINRWIDEWTDGWMKEWMNRWMDGWKEGASLKTLSTGEGMGELSHQCFNLEAMLQCCYITAPSDDVSSYASEHNHCQ